MGKGGERRGKEGKGRRSEHKRRTRREQEGNKKRTSGEVKKEQKNQLVRERKEGVDVEKVNKNKKSGRNEANGGTNASRVHTSQLDAHLPLSHSH